MVDAVGEAVQLLHGNDQSERLAAIEGEIRAVDRERERLVAAIAAGGALDGLVAALQAREATGGTLEAKRDAMRAERRLGAVDANRMRDEPLELATSWRRVLANQIEHARPVVTALPDGRVTFTPKTDGRKGWIVNGVGTLSGLFQTAIFPLGMASPTGFVPS